VASFGNGPQILQEGEELADLALAELDMIRAAKRIS
jgi:hypothetical protein